VNITVVGAGIVGCAIAHELASRGAQVRVVDPRGTGQGATRASAGMLAPQIEGHAAALLRLGVRSLDLYDTFIARIRADSPLPFEYDRSGSLQVAVDEAEAEPLRETAERLAASGVRHERLDARAAQRFEPALSSRVTEALFIPVHGYVTASALTLAMADACARRGVGFTTAAVTGIRPTAEGVEVSTPDEVMGADAVVLAAGSWSASAWRDRASPPVKPIRGQLLHLRAGARAASRIVWGSACYLVPWEDGSVLVGATVEDVGFDERATVCGVRRLLEGATSVLPTLSGAAFEDVRVGLRPMTPDELPIIGPSSTMRGVFYATGHYRNGVLLTPITAALIAGLVMDGTEGEELTLTRPNRFGL
jgi:glycine oxidase